MDAVELQPIRRWPGDALAAQFQDEAQGPAFARLLNGEYFEFPHPHVEFMIKGQGTHRGAQLNLDSWVVQRNPHGQTYEAISDACYREEFEPAGDELVPMDQLVNTLPDPVEFRRRLMAAARKRYADTLTDQGEVHDAADTFQVLRNITGTLEVVKQYASTFGDLAKELATYQRDQLERIPQRTEALTVPDAEGDISVQLDQYNVHEIDTIGLMAATSAVVLSGTEVVEVIVSAVEDAADADQQQRQVENQLANVLHMGMMLLVDLGKFEPQVTKVREFAKQQARTGADGLAAVIAGTIRSSRETRRGAKFTRKEPKS